MAANPKCRLEVTHSARGLTVLNTTWSDLGWRLFGGDATKLQPLFDSLKATKKAEYVDESGTLYITAIDNVEH